MPGARCSIPCWCGSARSSGAHSSAAWPRTATNRSPSGNTRTWISPIRSCRSTSGSITRPSRPTRRAPLKRRSFPMPTVTGPYIQAPNPASVLLGRGKLFLDLFDASGNRTGQQDVGNVTVFDVENKVEIKEKYESMDPASSLYARGVTRQTVTLKITGDEYTLDNLARVLLGTVETITAAGASAAAEALTPAGGAVLGRYYDLAHRNVTALTD